MPQPTLVKPAFTLYYWGQFVKLVTQCGVAHMKRQASTMTDPGKVVSGLRPLRMLWKIKLALLSPASARGDSGDVCGDDILRAQLASDH